MTVIVSIGGAPGKQIKIMYVTVTCKIKIHLTLLPMSGHQELDDVEISFP